MYTIYMCLRERGGVRIKKIAKRGLHTRKLRLGGLIKRELLRVSLSLYERREMKRGGVGWWVTENGWIKDPTISAPNTPPLRALFAKKSLALFRSASFFFSLHIEERRKSMLLPSYSYII